MAEEKNLDGLSPEKSHKDNVKISVESILSNKVKSKKVRRSPEDKKKQAFCTAINAVDNVIGRELLLEEDFGIDLSSYNSAYRDAIEGLLDYILTPAQKSIVDYFLYDRINDLGETTGLEDAQGNVVYLDTAADLYEFLKQI